MGFKKAEKRQSKLRLGFVGPSGAGKSYTALAVGCAIAELAGGRACAIDTERGSLSLYADQFDFDVMELPSFGPDQYLNAIREAEKAGYKVCIIDSLSHAWAGKDGILEMVDRTAEKNKGENRFTAWRTATPLHNQLVDALLTSPMHIIVTMRSKTEYVMEEYTDRNGNKKTKPVKIGMQPIQRDGMEYEFTICGDIDQEHIFNATKSRCPAVDGKSFLKPGRDLAETLWSWLMNGEPETATPVQAPASPPKPHTPCPPNPRFAAITAVCEELDIDKKTANEWIRRETGLPVIDLDDIALAAIPDALRKAFSTQEPTTAGVEW